MPLKASPGSRSAVAGAVRATLYYRSYQHGGRLERHAFDGGYIERLSNGDKETEQHFTRYFGDLLFLKLRARVRSPQLAEDARQETLLRVLSRLRSKGAIDHPERLGAFVNSVCENVLSEMFRAERRFQQPAEHAPERADVSPGPESQFVTEERKELVREVLGKLSVGDRRLLRGVFLEEKDKDEIAREFGTNRDYLRVRIHRALLRFRAALSRREESARLAKSAGR